MNCPFDIPNILGYYIKRIKGKNIMDKNEVKNLKPGQALRLISDLPHVIVCFVKIGHKGNPVISWPNMGGGCPVEPKDIEVVDTTTLTDREIREYNTAVMGMERHYPEVDKKNKDL